MFFKKLSAHTRGVAITFCGGLALSFDIPVVRLADGTSWSILAARSILTVLVAIAVWVVIRVLRGKAPVLVPGWHGVIISVFYAISTIFFILSVFNTTSANVAFILAFNPMFAALLSWMFLSEKPRLATFVAMAAMTVGVLIIVSSGLESGHLFGDVMAALSALSIAAALTFSRASGKDFGFTPLVAAIIPAVLGGIIAAESGFHIASPGWIIFNGLFLTPFAFWALAVGPQYLSAAETGMFYLLETVLAPVWVWLIFSEQPPLSTLIGGAIILVALVWHSIHTARREDIPLH